MFRKFLVVAAALLVSTSAFAQSQAMNGLVEGVVKDSSGGVLPGVNVTVTNTTTGETKTFVTDASGNYRAPLLSLGVYKVRIELSGFKTYERAGFSFGERCVEGRRERRALQIARGRVDHMLIERDARQQERDAAR